MIKVKSFALFIICVTILTACFSKQVSDVRDEPQTAKGIKETGKGSRSFENFVERFSTDSIFQTAHVAFPLTMLTWEAGTDVPSETQLGKRDWRHLSFEYDSSYATRQYDAYIQSVSWSRDTAKVELRGVDNGIMTDFEFLSTDTSWLLIRIKDFSN